MFKILLADDEGIVTDTLKFIINKNFPDQCIVESAASGRSVIELAETFKPDIAFMDIQMPGINGIDAMKEIRKTNHSVIFIIMTAYDKFNYAKQAINLRVLEYLTKPVSQQSIVSILTKAMSMIEEDRKKRMNDLIIREKLETVIPIIEGDFIYAILSGDEFNRMEENYKNLLNIPENYGMMMIYEFGDSIENGVLTNPVGVSVKAQAFYNVIKDSIKDEFRCVVGPLMMNRIVIFLPSMKQQLDYDERSVLIEKNRKIIRELVKSLDVQFKVGIGSVTSLQKLYDSYQEALSAIQNSKGRVAHVKDLPIGCEYEDDYPIDIEKSLYDMIEKGNVEGAKTEASRFYHWMVEHYPDCMMDIKLKVLETVLFAEQKAFLSGGMTYYFEYRKNYLKTIIDIDNYELLLNWFLDKVMEASRNITLKKKEQVSGTIAKAKLFIKENYHKDISLDDVSRSVDISPYYFSKLFKDEAKVNFIDYLTNIRIEKAKELLLNRDFSIKNICMEIGLRDPNYFSRIFKKQVGLTPTEYRENINSK
ncbi:response regulator [Lachnospiraceae bacterium MD1]|uniref:Stage 0 sporulation protein A homolog n=1 Tax=Variimorphobacter saccharofermentans TaxID=2755051 RepID=A0A839JYY6_9FIRM|nr:response regulator [Variimorphobacter saccharofermentans]MBB2182620.1 response regulator [Variimorphobacter saccharofermentans]